MSGQGSAATPSFQSAGFSQDDISNFATSKASSQWKPEDVAQLNGAGHWADSSDPGKTFANNNYNGADISGLAAAFRAWKADQDNAGAGWNKYVDLVNKEGGGQGTQTILTGSASTPYQTILAAQQQGIGKPNTPRTPQVKGGIA